MSTVYPTHAHTRGTTFSRAAMVALPAGVWVPTSVIKTRAGQLLQVLDCNLHALPQPDADGNTHSLSVLASAADTSAWPISSVMWVTTFEDASAEPVIVPAVTRVVQVGQYTLPTTAADNPLAVITDFMAPVLRGEKGDTGDAGAGGPGGGATNLAYTASAAGGTVTSDTGTDATLPLADGTNAGLMAPAQHSKLAGLPSSADAAGTAASAVSAHAAATDPHGDRAWASGQFAASAHNHTGTYDPAGTAASAVSTHVGQADPHTQYALESALGTAAAAATTDFTPAAHAGAGGTAHANAVAGGAAGFMSGSDKTKLDGIAAGAQVNPSTTDSLTEGSTNLYHTAARVRATVLTGLSTAAGTVVAATHTVLEALGFLQKQVSDNATAITNAKSRSVTVLLPVTNDEITLFRARSAMTITKLIAVGGGFTYTVRKAADRSATGTEVVTGGSTVTSTTTGDVVTSFNSASIAQDDWVWLKLTSVTGTPASFNLTMEF